MGLKSAIAAGLMIASLGAASVPVPVEAKSAQSEFSDAWKARDERYTAEVEQLDAKLKSALSDLSNGPRYPEGLDRLRAVYAALDASANMQGKQALLRAFRAFMNDRPSSERTQFWFQEEEARLRDAVRNSNTQLEAAKQLRLGKDGVGPERYTREWNDAIWTSAVVRGNIDELQLLAENSASFFQARETERVQRRAAWANVLQGLGNAARNYNNSMNSWSASCRTFMGRTTCTGD